MIYVYTSIPSFPPTPLPLPGPPHCLYTSSNYNMLIGTLSDIDTEFSSWGGRSHLCVAGGGPGGGGGGGGGI